MKISKANLLLAAHFLMLSGLCSASNAQNNNNQDIGDYYDNNYEDGIRSDAQPEREVAGPLTEQNTYESNTMSYADGSSNDSSSDDSREASLEGKVERSLKHTTRDEDDDSIESIEDTIEREIILSAKHVDALEAALKKTESYLSEADPVKEYNKQFSWRRWNRVKNVDQIQKVITQQQQAIAQAQAHIKEMLTLAFEVSQKESSVYNQQQADLQKYLESSDPVKAYNNQFGVFGYFNKISNVDQLKAQLKEVGQKVAYWNNYMQKVRAIALPKMDMSVMPKMPKHGIGITTKMPHGLPSSSYKSNTTILGRKLTTEETQTKKVKEHTKKKQGALTPEKHGAVLLKLWNNNRGLFYIG